ncbi:MAG TPA: GDP-mannose 4,6-dehydratase [Terriglobales bacterium]|nr:GDP-mannose 4,6-dehydratase [Terriglobales bacterium]
MGERKGSILLTGGAGFVGSHLAEALLRADFPLNIVDHLDPFYPTEWKQANLEDLKKAGKFQLHVADIVDYDSVREAFAAMPPEVVIHLAARAGVRPSIEQPRLYEQINIVGTLNVLELCREFKVQRLIFGSSSSVYGLAPAPFSEEQLDLRPVSPYAATKLAGEIMCATWSRLYQMAVVVLRFFTVYGPRQRPDLAIHKFTGMIERGAPIPFYGDGSTGRDYTYVDDTVAGILRALSYVSRREPDGGFCEIFNLGNSKPVKLSELVEAMEEATGRKATRDLLPAQPGDVPLTWADISKAERVLGYKPAISLEDGLRRFVHWYRSVNPERRA